MFTVVPTAAVALTEAALCSLADSAKSVADALRPLLDASQSPVDQSMPRYKVEKVASCKAVYSALLRSDGTLLLLSNPVIDGAARSAHISVLESGGEPVVDVAAGASHIVYCTVSGAVYSCGCDNTYGQLGDGSVWSYDGAADGFAEGQGLLGTSAPGLRAPRRVAGFGEGALADGAHDGSLSSGDTDALVGCGTDCRAAIGLALSPSSLASGASSSAAAANGRSACAPAASRRRVPPPGDRHIAQVACGAHHTLLLTRSGHCIYACGTGEQGQLGGSRLILVQPTFRAIPLLFGMDIVQVAAAGAHSFVLLRSGLLYAFGDNMCGQMGLGHTKRVSRPTAVPLTGREDQEALAAQDDTAATSRGRRPLDAKAYATLRAPYGSTESTYYPLRVPRLRDDESRDRGAALAAKIEDSGPHHGLGVPGSSIRVVRVYCSMTWTLLETTSPGVWLSCGTMLTRGVSQACVTTAAAARVDGCDVLGRLLLRAKTDAYVFRPVHWAATLSRMREEAEAATPGPAAPQERVGVGLQGSSAGPFDGAEESPSHRLQLPGIPAADCRPLLTISGGETPSVHPRCHHHICLGEA
ncbi:hypothetical protein JKF63_00259 [Porcisia hertigi]|uniref:Uncharacterized protein n=1 Tax=Porcisia hertigi TaxID=2761500 RepID=A0A836HTA8_9TRYP|nr:hypothetical protein JKF63_00259 [Porcisia hertigi]